MKQPDVSGAMCNQSGMHRHPEGYRFLSLKHQAFNRLLVCPQAKDEDNGKYTLLVKNTAGEAKAESMIDVMGKPKPPRVVKEIEPKQVKRFFKIISLCYFL
jgi:hypothetical protein